MDREADEPLPGLSGRVFPYEPRFGFEEEEWSGGPAGAEDEGSPSEDWLDDLRASADEVVHAEPPVLTGPADSRSIDDDLEPLEPVDIPDWLSGMGPVGGGRLEAPDAETGAPFEAPYLWQPAEEPPSEGLAAGEPTLAAADIPQWLRELAPDEAYEQSGPSPLLDDDEFLDLPEFPDWLRDLGPKEGGTPAPSVEDLAFPGEPIPEPAAGLETRHLVPEKGEMPEAGWEPDYAGELGWEEGPGWLGEMAFSPEPEEAPLGLSGAQPDEPISTAIRIPDWLKESLAPEAELAAAAPVSEEPVLSEERPLLAEGEALEGALPTGVKAEVAVAPEVAPDLEELPSWLREEGPAVGDVAPEPEIPYTEERPSAPALPAWLAEILAEPPAATEEGAPSPTEKAPEEAVFGVMLERADIPQWLQDLRPGDTQDRVPVAGPMETEGLLQGLLDLLPTSLAVRIPSSHRGQTAALPGEASLARAELLQSLLGQPISAPLPVSKVGQDGTSSAVGRRLVAIVLVLVVLGTLLAPLVIRGVPHLAQPGVTSGALRLYEMVDELGAGDDVLVAFDYGAPEADELSVTARPVLEHVVGQGANVSIVSTRPDGALVASALMSEIASSPGQYSVLSYRPGAATAVSQLLTAVDRPPSLLLVLTSRVGPMRQWVELARVHYGDQLPVALVGSAALEPVASPYVDGNAGQVTGFIHGLRGGASYELLRGASGDATQRLNALAAGQVAIVLLMVVGGIYHGIGRLQRGNP